MASCPLPLASKFSAWQPGAEVEGFDDARKATRIEKSEQSSPSTEINIGYPETERVRGREPVLEAGEHRAVRHNTRRRSLNHYDSTEPSGRLIGHNRFPTLPSPLFPSGFKGRFVVLCCIFFPFVGLCPPSLSPGGAPLSAQPIFASVGGILPSSCISPNLYCLLLEIFCLLGICCLRFCFLWQQNRSKRRRGVCGDNNSCRRGNSFAAM